MTLPARPLAILIDDFPKKLERQAAVAISAAALLAL
jgi:hypothetical protein